MAVSDDEDTWGEVPKVSDDDLGHPAPVAPNVPIRVNTYTGTPQPGETAESFKARRAKELSAEGEAEDAAARPQAEAARAARAEAAKAEYYKEHPPAMVRREEAGPIRGADIPLSLANQEVARPPLSSAQLPSAPIPQAPTSEPTPAPGLLPSLQQNAQALQAPPVPPGASGGRRAIPAQGQAPSGLVGPSPEPTAPLSAAPQTPPAPETPRAPSMVEQLLASREQDRADLRAAQQESEYRRLSASGINNVRAGLAMMVGQSPNSEQERIENENADAPVRDVLARQKSDQDFQTQLQQASEMDRKRDADDVTSPMSVRSTLMARSIGYRGPPITASEWAQTHDVLQLQEIAKQRETQAKAEAVKASHETDMQQFEREKLKQEMALGYARIRAEQDKGAKVPPMSPQALQQLGNKMTGLEANEAARSEGDAAGLDYWARNRAIDRHLPAMAAGVAAPGTRENINFMEGVKQQMPMFLRGKDDKDQWHDSHHDEQSKEIEDALDLNSQDPRIGHAREIYGTTQQKVLTHRYGNKGQVEMHKNGDTRIVPVGQVHDAILAGARLTQ